MARQSIKEQMQPVWAADKPEPTPAAPEPQDAQAQPDQADDLDIADSSDA